MWVERLKNTIADQTEITSDNDTVERLSKDAYWYSPILYKELNGMKAECAVFPKNEEEVRTVVAFAVKEKIPLTVRGSGTGNYGQSIPLSGGIIIDITQMNQTVKEPLHL
ncbi:FAD-binding oxidoreductase [Sinobaca sp. H24]|uniref:FAD-binding oxidoreductase n=1 Tax=Sinobaca sp. H24 TaxID=2923376 RepID=UPI00207B0DEB|nr:FAD-binding protein [Sinobaca sp. H24]